jgi:hypothetical protein
MCNCKCEDPKKIKGKPDACDSKQIEKCHGEGRETGTKDIKKNKKPSDKCQCES